MYIRFTSAHFHHHWRIMSQESSSSDSSKSPPISTSNVTVQRSRLRTKQPLRNVYNLLNRPCFKILLSFTQFTFTLSLQLDCPFHTITYNNIHNRNKNTYRNSSSPWSNVKDTINLCKLLILNVLYAKMAERDFSALKHINFLVENRNI